MQALRISWHIPPLYGRDGGYFDFLTTTAAYKHWDGIKKAIARAGYELRLERFGRYLVFKNDIEVGWIERNYG